MKFLLCIAVFFLIQNGESATIATKDLLHELQELSQRLIAETKVAQPGDTNVYPSKELREEPQHKAMHLREESPLAATLRQNPNTLRSAENSYIGFTAYLEKGVHLQPGQTLCYDTVVTNEGLAYNPNSGVFTCPFSGFYLFSFSVATRNANQVWVRLTVNDAPQIDGAAEGNKVYQDDQGSGTVVLNLMAGDIVSVKAFDDMEYTIDSMGGRFNYFSGVLLIKPLC